MPGEHPIEVIHDMLKLMVRRNASDLFISVGFPPALKIDGKVTPISDQVLTEVHTKQAHSLNLPLNEFAGIIRFVNLPRTPAAFHFSLWRWRKPTA